eukprot:TRINITY_DN2604_c0_g1_i1.p1 TRINITY_DN2604_c0_g1~~TRINITY_DN2604_c0_g1_i1.p1  ORF type:complete len:255 (-),score=80.65 TRINITY_DN2604_c0_g1_i1:30-794(-)
MSENKNESEFSGKVVAVTGGSKGIGADIVKKFALSGAKVAFSYSSSESQAKALETELADQGKSVCAFKANHALTQDCVDFVKFVHGKYGNIDILVNNAGVLSYAAIGEDTEELYLKQMDVNVKGVWATTNAAVKLMNDGGRIINMGSIGGERGFVGGASVYVASKFAVQGFTRAWSRDLGSRKITVNCVHAGPINTDMNPDVPANAGAAFFKGITSLGRYGEVGEVTSLVLFLASDKSSYITGTCIRIDGGAIA